MPEEAFAGVPQSSLLEAGGLPIEEVAGLALREGQRTAPIYRVHRWFARRLGSQVRAILASLTLRPDEVARFWDRYLGDVRLEGAVVLDPFVGGGTTVVEAARCGARVIGYDVDPVAAFITRFELEAAAHDPAVPKVTAVCAAVRERVLPFHTTVLPDGSERVVLHHFWVECRRCHGCGAEFEVHPHYRLAYSREQSRQWVFCRRCHAVAELPLGREGFRCGCGASTELDSGTLVRGAVRCPDCGAVAPLSGRSTTTVTRTWRLFAQEYLEDVPGGVVRRFKAATEVDHARYAEAARLLAALEREEGVFAPARPIPVEGRADQRPLIHGVTRYRDLFNDRQLLHLTVLGRAITGVEDPKARRLLTLAFSEHLTSTCRYAAYAFGYRRLSPLFSIHGYRHVARPVEVNPWLAGLGRGTFPNVLRKIAAAVADARVPTLLHPAGGRTAVGSGRALAGPVAAEAAAVLEGRSPAAVVAKDAAWLAEIPDAAVDLIVTDPPYFDNVSYSELSDFYLAWHQVLGVAEPPYDDVRRPGPLAENLAARNRSAEAVAAYRARLARILQECRRVLKPEGVLVFTYHHRSAAAWAALGEAMVRAGWRCTGVVPLRGEGRGGLHSYGGTIKWDAVLVCRPGGAEPVDRAGGKESPVCVTREAVLRARERAAAYAARLGRDRLLGFREPDRVNLERALIVAAARAGNGDVPLAAALREAGRSGGGQCRE